MKIIQKNIKLGQRLVHALGGSIKTNTIVNKTICGCGATYSEIKAPRHSIIVEPNLPVIKGKEKDHPEIFGVYEGRNRPHIKKYVNQMIREGRYMKFITTPESFRKIRDALMEMGLDLYADFFLLFDECERTIQDIDYRGSIELPMDEFFNFHNKAMVSATPLMPSDPRFREQGFTMVKLTPDYDYKQKIGLITTNNTIAVMRRMFERWKGERIFIFMNATNQIYNIICTFGLQGKSKVFCSDKSVKKLQTEFGFSDAYDHLTEFAEFNFFTSRFFSAVDIMLDYKPNVMILTDVFRAKQTMMDPQTEVVQILGRFRNGVGKRVHITNYNTKLEWKTESQMEKYLCECEKFYTGVTEQKFDKTESGSIDSQKQAKEGMEYDRFVKNGKRNYYMWDNAKDEERIKSYYQATWRLLNAYKDSPLIAVHQNIDVPLSDEDILRRTKPRISFCELSKVLVEQLDKLQQNPSDLEYTYQMKEIKECCDFTVTAYFILGGEKLGELGYKKTKIETALKNHENNIRFTDPKVVKAVYDRYKVGDIVPISEVIVFFRQLVKEYNIPYTGRYTSDMMGRYFEIYKTSRTKKVRMIELVEQLL